MLESPNNGQDAQISERFRSHSSGRMMVLEAIQICLRSQTLPLCFISVPLLAFIQDIQAVSSFFTSMVAPKRV